MLSEDIRQPECIHNLYSAKVVEEIASRKGCWSTLRVNIFSHSEGKKKKIGSYNRNYPTLFDTFCPFVGQDGKHYALYSSHYGSTRVLRLDTCKDIGGEENVEAEFCPTGYYVPLLTGWVKPTNCPPKVGFDWYATNKVITRYAPFAFVSGCYWGDDSSYKIQVFDLTDAHNGVIKRDDRLGYVEVLGKISESVSIETDFVNDSAFGEGSRVLIATANKFDFHWKMEEK